VNAVPDDRNALVRVKVYGLVSLTRRAYLICQTVGLTLGLILMGIGFWGPRKGVSEFFAHFLDALPWVSLAILLAGALETALVLGQFRRKEAERGG
jgi:hypothetical protein